MMSCRGSLYGWGMSNPQTTKMPSSVKPVEDSMFFNASIIQHWCGRMHRPGCCPGIDRSMTQERHGATSGNVVVIFYPTPETLTGVLLSGRQVVAFRPSCDGVTCGWSRTEKLLLLCDVRDEFAGSEEQEHLDQVVAQF